MTSIQTQSIQAALYAAGTTLELSIAPIDASAVPPVGGQGYAVGSSIQATLLVGMRRATPGRQVDIRVTTPDLAATYTAIIGGNSVAYSGAPADVEALVTAWAAAITADGTVGASGSALQTTATPVDSTGSGIVDTARIRGLTADSWSFTATRSGSTATLAVALDPEEATVSLYGTYSLVPTIAQRVTDSDDLAQLTGWQLLQGVSGDATLAITDGQSRAVQAVVAGMSYVRPYLTGAAGVTGDGSGTVSGVTYTLVQPSTAILRGVI